MSSFREEVSGKPSEPSPSSVINAIDANIKENKLILTDENGKIITLTLTEDALKQLPDVLSSTSSLSFLLCSIFKIISFMYQY